MIDDCWCYWLHPAGDFEGMVTRLFVCESSQRKSCYLTKTLTALARNIASRAVRAKCRLCCRRAPRKNRTACVTHEGSTPFGLLSGVHEETGVPRPASRRSGKLLAARKHWQIPLQVWPRPWLKDVCDDSPVCTTILRKNGHQLAYDRFAHDHLQF